MSHETDRAALARVDTDHCHGIVTRDGEMDACGKPAVAIMDDITSAGYWPACAYHANRYGPAVPLAQVLTAHAARVAAETRESVLAEVEQAFRDLRGIEAEFGPLRVQWECPHVDDHGTVPHDGDLRRLVSEWRADR